MKTQIKNNHICCNCNKCKIIEVQRICYNYVCCNENNEKQVNPEDTCHLGIWDEDPDGGPDWEY